MDDQIDALLNIVVIVVFVALFAILLSKASDPTGAKKEKCKKHKWSHHPVSGKMECMECGYKAGSDFDPRN